jgi:hypothetical protein
MKVETIAEQLYFTTILIESRTNEGITSVGTGFIIDAEYKTRHGSFLVTNKHVINGGTEGVLRFHLKQGGNLNLRQGYKLNVPNFKTYWISHPDSKVDVTVMSMSVVLEHAKQSVKELYYRSIPQSVCPSEKDLEELDALEELVFVGYPLGIYDEAHYLPVVRRGITASPLQVDHDGERKFLIDAAVFPGSSGSPVFILDRGVYPKRGAGVVLGDRTLFLGILSAGYYESSVGAVVQVPIPTGEQHLSGVGKQMINLGVVFKAETVFELAKSMISGEPITKSAPEIEDKLI